MTRKNPNAVALGKKGGAVKHPAKGMGSATPEQRAERNRKMLAARWGKKKGTK